MCRDVSFNVPSGSTASSWSSSVTLAEAGDSDREGPLAQGPVGGHQRTGDGLTDHIELEDGVKLGDERRYKRGGVRQKRTLERAGMLTA